MKTAFFLLLLGTALYAQTASPTTQKRLDELRKGFETAVTSQAGTAYTSAAKALDSKYVAALERMIAMSTQGGKLDDAVALRDEKKRVTDSLPLPESDAEVPEILRSMRSTYREQLASIAAIRDKTTEPLKKRYLEELQRLEAERAKAGSLDDALAVRSVTETLKPSSESPASSADKHKVVVAKGNGQTDSKAAKEMVEWALANGAIVETDLGSIGPKEKLNTLPTKRFSVIKIQSQAATEAFPWHLLDGLSELNRIDITQNTPLKSDDLAHMKSLGILSQLSLNGAVSAEALAALPSMPSVRMLAVNSIDEIASAVPQLRGKFPAVSLLGYRSASISEEVIAEIAKWPYVTHFQYRGPLTLAMAESLAAMPRLDYILFYSNAKIDPQGIRKLVRHTAFTYQGSEPNPGMVEALASLPVLKTLTLEAACVAPTDIPFLGASKSLQTFKLMRLDGLQLAVARLVPALCELTHLRELLIANSDITDADLISLTKMKGLRRLDITKTQVTDATLKAFKKAVPKCEIVH
jgi:hypothetical protein